MYEKLIKINDLTICCLKKTHLDLMNKRKKERAESEKVGKDIPCK